ncbi:MAG TPA: G/U mismatch-specific DNA glycosylase [Phycisphaerales bacterium]|nr:G/U mismatch-specific DNA glycosylase [Phycisphaerales bacterium]
MARPSKPTAAQLAAANGKCTVPDVVGPGMRVLFVGINPGLWSGATGHHFARPGNRLWPALHRAGLTPHQFHPSEDGRLLELGLGMSKLVTRATATAAELSDEEMRRGGARIRRLVRKWRPGVVCFLGLGAYKQAYGLKRVTLGLQAEPFEGAALWVLPNPSGLNANHQLPDYVRMFTQLREATGLACLSAADDMAR